MTGDGNAVGPHHMTADEFRRAGHQIVDWIAEYLGHVERRPVQAAAKPGEVFRAVDGGMPERGEAWADTWQQFVRDVMPGVTHWQHPGFYGFFPCNSSGPAILGELLSAGLGINGFLWQCSPAITELEMRVMDWLAQAIDLPGSFMFGDAGAKASGGGVIHGTASEAVLTAMVAARDRAVRAHGEASRERHVVYTSTQAHSSVLKAAMVSGVGAARTRMIEVDERLAMRADALQQQIERDIAAGLIPVFVCATLGTTSTGAIDPLPRIAEISRERSMWLHVDAAYAGAAAVCPEHRAMLAGVEHADSFNFNPHKWLLTNFDCSAFWVRDKSALVQALSVTPEYLRNKASASGDVVDYRDWQVPLGRRFRALKLWFVLRHYGAEGLRAYIREHVRLGELFESLVRGDARFDVPTPRCLSLVCFMHKAGDEATRALLERANATGRVWMTSSVVPVGPGGASRMVIRMAIGATQTQERHVREAWSIIQSCATDAAAR